MFSSALKSFTSNISSNYKLADAPSASCGPWKIYDAKKRSGGKAVSVFLFERKYLEPQSSGFGGRGNASSMKKVHDEVVDRLKREASSLARLRHPSILELAEPVEETRSGGLMFATEPVSVSLAGLLEEKDGQESRGGVSGRTSRYVVEDTEGGGRKRREVEIDELEIQKGLLQIGKGLEFLHESAGLIHANLTPSSIVINAKGDWKLAGLGFSTPPANSNSSAATPSIALSEVLNHDPRLPRTVQLDLDYASPDFVLDNNLTTSADMFSLGLIVIALYKSPHVSPLDTGQSTSNYRRLFSSTSSIPTANNNFLVTQALPRDIKGEVLPRLITRRPAQRYGAREFQQAQYFDNILVSTIRFLDSLPAKSPNEKSQFMRGLPRILGQFPKSVLEKKVLPALLDETKDLELLSLVLQNVFKTLEQIPSSRRAFSERVLPAMRSIFVQAPQQKGKEQDRDTRKEAGLLVVLENMSSITTNCSGKDFKDDVLPMIYLALESPTASLVDSALQNLSLVLSVLDFSTIKNELFPVVSQVFSKTSSMSIKIRSLEALGLLCGAAPDEAPDDLSGLTESSKSNSTNSSIILDKYTVQEKVVPLLRGIKTKEPAVMMAALTVFKQVGKVCDSDFIALQVLPVLWAFSLGPLLNLDQFQAFMGLIKNLSTRIETEQTRKLSELSSSSTSRPGMNGASNSFGSGSNGFTKGLGSGEEGDFESLVTGRKSNVGNDVLDGGWGAETTLRPSTNNNINQSQTTNPPVFAWSTPVAPTASTRPQQQPTLQPKQASQNIYRAITPDQSLSSFATLTPSHPITANPWAAPAATGSNQSISSHRASTSVDWSRTSAAVAGNDAGWGKPNVMSSAGAGGFGATGRSPQQPNAFAGFNMPPPPTSTQPGVGGMGQTQGNAQKQGMEKYESLI